LPGGRAQKQRRLRDSPQQRGQGTGYQDGLRAIYQTGFKYAKAGIMLLELQPDKVQQIELDLQDDDEQEDRGRLMTTLDTLNQRYGRGTVLMASAGLAGDRRSWSMKQERRTPGYTTCWQDMPVVRA
jgi:DNA polymerase V